MYKTISTTALAVALCPLFATGQARLSGVVKNQEGENLQGAHVTLEKALKGMYTDAEGGFDFGVLNAGTYYVSASYLGYEPHRDTVQIDKTPVNLDIALVPRPFMTGEVTVEATRMSPRSPGTFETLTKQKIEARNLGQDLPYLLNFTPSIVTTSDAGAGVGYTGLRIRGSDQTRINVTLNGIPINDPESQVVVWVNMPDLATSLSSVQIQRGLGSSTNGSGAFGASINMETDEVTQEAGGLVANSFGSYNTMKNTVEYRTGLSEKGFAAEGRLSSIQSDGYIDRASSRLRSYYLSAGYYGAKTLVKAITFSGDERTYQSWYGTPESRVENDTPGMLAHAAREGYTEDQTENLLNSGRTYNYYTYPDEVDRYTQTHYQLHVGREFNDQWRLNIAGHYTRGDGYFEQYKRDRDILGDFGKPYPTVGNDTIESTDAIVRRWLGNDFYGATYALKHDLGRSRFTLGGGAHFYRGDHYGEVLWADSAVNIAHNERYYNGTGDKDEYNAYAKWEYAAGPWNLMADLQVRAVDYKTLGTDNDLTRYDVAKRYTFFNPKVGARYGLDARNHVYAYFGRGHREPVRNDFIDADPGETPRFETLNDLELGYGHEGTDVTLKLNGYLMSYRDQLVLTGALNDTGNPVRENVARSYRAGVEAQATWQVFRRFLWSANIALSRNRIVDFDYVLGGETTSYAETDIAFSPNVVAANRFSWRPVDGLEVALTTKYVGPQYLDNTSSADKMLDAYAVSDFLARYVLRDVLFKEIELNLMVNNVFDAMYSSNGYTYSYVYNGVVTENFQYPQAGINFLAGMNLRF